MLPDRFGLLQCFLIQSFFGDFQNVILVDPELHYITFLVHTINSSVFGFLPSAYLFLRTMSWQISLCSFNLGQVVRTVGGNMATGYLYSRIIPLVLLLVDGKSFSDQGP